MLDSVFTSSVGLYDRYPSIHKYLTVVELYPRIVLVSIASSMVRNCDAPRTPVLILAYAFLPRPMLVALCPFPLRACDALCALVLDDRRFGDATQIAYGFWLYDLCDTYLELIKPVVGDKSDENKEVDIIKDEGGGGWIGVLWMIICSSSLAVHVRNYYFWISTWPRVHGFLHTLA